VERRWKMRRECCSGELRAAGSVGLYLFFLITVDWVDPPKPHEDAYKSGPKIKRCHKKETFLVFI
jgi:hypothetical protein